MRQIITAEQIFGMEMPELVQNITDDFTDLSPLERTSYQALALARAEQLGNKQIINKLFTQLAKQEKTELAQKRMSKIPEGLELKYTDSGLPQNTIENFVAIMQFDDAYARIKYNSLTNSAEIHSPDGKITKWNNGSISQSRNYIESKYGIYNKDKHRDALNILFQEREYNPILDIISTLKWDGVERMEEFLVKWGKCDDTPYTREVSRLIFACGMWRLIVAGCKVDDVPVLVGKQGSGKSSLVRFLALNDNYFGEVKTTDGDAKSIEQLSGKWILEIPELSAFTKAKEVESVKAFITRQRDMYRTPYAELVEERPRKCIFIGTTNNPNFLVDLSGNRRFYPVETHCNGYDLYDHEKEIREYIMLCWAEAYAKFNLNQLPNFANRDLSAEYEAHQDDAMQDDWRIGAIRGYLNEKSVGDKVCVKEIMTEVLSPDPEHPLNPTGKDSKDIGIIMSKMTDWTKTSNYRTSRWAVQKGWVRISGEVVPPKIEVPSGEGLPF